MTDISQTIPTDVWLESITVSSKELKLLGKSLGYSPISDFIKSLDQSLSFKEVALKDTKVDHVEDGADVNSFEISALKRSTQ